MSSSSPVISNRYIDLKFLFCASGIFLCYFYYGILQEKITRTKYGPTGELFTCSMSLVFIQCLINTLFAIGFNYVQSRFGDGLSCHQGHKHNNRDTTSHYFYGCSAFSYLTAMVASNRALQHVAYPTQVIAKSCKPIPVMILGVLYARKRYPLKKYCYVCLIVLGVGIFMYKPDIKTTTAIKTSEVTTEEEEQDSTTTDNILQTFSGELLLLLSLTMDGFTGAIQERMKSEHQTKPGQMMLWINCWAVGLLSIPLILTGELFQFINFIQRFPFVISFIMQFSLMSAFGQLFIFLSISTFSSLICSLITTTRKFFTVLVSVLLFGNNLSGQQWFGAGLVFLGLGLDMLYGKQRQGQKLREQQQLPIIKINKTHYQSSKLI